MSSVRAHPVVAPHRAVRQPDAPSTLSPTLTSFGQTNWGGIMASGVLTTLPVVLIFILIQRVLVQARTAGPLTS